MHIAVKAQVNPDNRQDKEYTQDTPKKSKDPKYQTKIKARRFEVTKFLQIDPGIKRNFQKSSFFSEINTCFTACFPARQRNQTAHLHRQPVHRENVPKLHGRKVHLHVPRTVPIRKSTFAHENQQKSKNPLRRIHRQILHGMRDRGLGLPSQHVRSAGGFSWFETRKSRFESASVREVDWFRDQQGAARRQTSDSHFLRDLCLHCGW